jgi:hypothetical protein
VQRHLEVLEMGYIFPTERFKKRDPARSHHLRVIVGYSGEILGDVEFVNQIGGGGGFDLDLTMLMTSGVDASCH